MAAACIYFLSSAFFLTFLLCAFNLKTDDEKEAEHKADIEAMIQQRHSKHAQE